MAGREDGGGGTGAMEEGRDAGRQAGDESSEDGGGGSDRCSSGSDMISVQFMQKVWSRTLL
jgi:aquaporin NIP